MAVIKIDTFGGEVPSASSRSITPGAARRAFNLLARVNEFRPLNKDIVKTTKAIEDAKPGTTFAADGQFVYRFTIDANGNPYANDTLGWKTNDFPLNYAKGQINDSLRERVYISSLDGTMAPRVVDATGVNKPLGVPAPAAAPSVTLNVVNEYSSVEAETGKATITKAVQDGLTSAKSSVVFGISPSTSPAPSATNSGWINHATATAAGLTLTTNDGDWLFLTPMSSGALVETKYNYLLANATQFSGSEVIFATHSYWAVPITMQGSGYEVNTIALTNSIKALVNPDPQIGGQLVPDANAIKYATDIAALFDPANAPQKNSIEALNVATKAFIAADAADDKTLNAPAMALFYAKTDVAAELTAAYLSFGQSMEDLQQRSFGSVTLSKTTIASALPTSAYMWTFADGHIELKYEEIRLWIDGSIREGIDASALTAAEKSDRKSLLWLGVRLPLDVLKMIMGPEHWSSREDWPIGSAYNQTTVDTRRAGEVLSAINAMRSASRRVASDYENVLARAVQTINDGYDTHIKDSLPTPTVRLPDSRFYVTTMVTSWGEESAPSPVSVLIEADQNDTVTIPRPTELGVSGTVANYLYTGWRIYRSNSGTTGTNFQLVADLALATTSFIDEKLGSELQEVLPTTTWLTPPMQDMPSGITISTPYLRGLTGMANGVMAGFFDNTVCFCEPYVPYAWPIEYQLTTKFQIVGMGSFGQTLFVGTKGIPYLISGSDSASMSAQELPGNQSCSSARSIASTETGVLYASPDGICLADYSGVKVVTQGLFTRDDWTAINPSSIVGAMHHGVYYFLYNNRETISTNSTGISWGDNLVTPANFKLLYVGIKQMIWDGYELQARAVYLAKQATYGFTDSQFAAYTPFTAEEIGQWKNNILLADPHRVGGWSDRITRPNGCYALDFATGKLTELDVSGTAFFVDVETDTLYVLDGTNIKALFSDMTQRRTGEYWTGVIKLGNQTPMAWLQVDSLFANPVKVHWYGDGEMRHSVTVTSNSPVRLPAGRYLEHQVMVESSDRITMVTLASTTQELQSI